MALTLSCWPCSYPQGCTRLLVTHQRQYLPQCDRVLVLRGGRLVGLGSWEEVAELGLPELDGIDLGLPLDCAGAGRPSRLRVGVMHHSSSSPVLCSPAALDLDMPQPKGQRAQQGFAQAQAEAEAEAQKAGSTEGLCGPTSRSVKVTTAGAPAHDFVLVTDTDDDESAASEQYEAGPASPAHSRQPGAWRPPTVVGSPTRVLRPSTAPGYVVTGCEAGQVPGPQSGSPHTPQSAHQQYLGCSSDIAAGPAAVQSDEVVNEIHGAMGQATTRVMTMDMHSQPLRLASRFRPKEDLVSRFRPRLSDSGVQVTRRRGSDSGVQVARHRDSDSFRLGGVGSTAGGSPSRLQRRAFQGLFGRAWSRRSSASGRTSDAGDGGYEFGTQFGIRSVPCIPPSQYPGLQHALGTVFAAAATRSITHRQNTDKTTQQPANRWAPAAYYWPILACILVLTTSHIGTSCRWHP